MAPLPEATYRELEELFETLKKISQRPIGAKEAHERTLEEHLGKMLARLDDHRQTITRESEPADWIKLTAMKSSLIYEEGKINLNAKKYLEAKENMNDSLEVIKGVEQDTFICYLHLRIVNHLAFILSKLDDHLAARNLLEEITAKEAPDDIVTFTTEELFAVNGITEANTKAKMHSININNLQMLSWVYGKMGLENESAITQHNILEKQMDYEHCDPVDWALRCIRVASLYLVRRMFIAARYYMSAASSALERTEGLIDHPDLGKAQAELARSWIYYGLKLFDVSRSKHINQMSSKIFDETGSQTSPDGNQAKEEPPLSDAITFQNSEVPLANVPAKAIQTISEARSLFLHTQMWLKRARIFYTLRDYPYIYVNCVLDLSELYRFLAFYEPDLEAQYIVNKKRSDALETLCTILKEVRPQCYFAVSVDLLRELAEVQIEMLGINLKKMYKATSVNESPKMTTHRLENVHRIHNKLEKISGFVRNDEQPNNGNCRCDCHSSTCETISETRILNVETQSAALVEEKENIPNSP